MQKAPFRAKFGTTFILHTTMSEKPADSAGDVTDLTGSLNVASHEKVEALMAECIAKGSLKSGAHLEGNRYKFATVTDEKQFAEEMARGKLTKLRWTACDYLVDKSTANEYRRAFKTGQLVMLGEKGNLPVHIVFFLRGTGTNIPTKVIVYNATHPKAFTALSKCAKSEDSYVVMLLDTFIKQAHHTNGKDLGDEELRKCQDECVAHVQAALTLDKRKEVGEQEQEQKPAEDKKKLRTCRAASHEDTEHESSLAEDMHVLGEAATKVGSATAQLAKSEKALKDHEARLLEEMSDLCEELRSTQQALNKSTTAVTEQLSALATAISALQRAGVIGSIAPHPFALAPTPVVAPPPTHAVTVQPAALAHSALSELGAAGSSMITLPASVLQALLGTRNA